MWHCWLLQAGSGRNRSEELTTLFSTSKRRTARRTYQAIRRQETVLSQLRLFKSDLSTRHHPIYCVPVPGCRRISEEFGLNRSVVSWSNEMRRIHWTLVWVLSGVSEEGGVLFHIITHRPIVIWWKQWFWLFQLYFLYIIKGCLGTIMTFTHLLTPFLRVRG